MAKQDMSELGFKEERDIETRQDKNKNEKIEEWSAEIKPKIHEFCIVQYNNNILLVPVFCLDISLIRTDWTT